MDAGGAPIESWAKRQLKILILSSELLYSRVALPLSSENLFATDIFPVPSDGASYTAFPFLPCNLGFHILVSRSLLQEARSEIPANRPPPTPGAVWWRVLVRERHAGNDLRALRRAASGRRLRLWLHGGQQRGLRRSAEDVCVHHVGRKGDRRAQGSIRVAKGTSLPPEPPTVPSRHRQRSGPRGPGTNKAGCCSKVGAVLFFTSLREMELYRWTQGGGGWGCILVAFRSPCLMSIHTAGTAEVGSGNLFCFCNAGCEHGCRLWGAFVGWQSRVVRPVAVILSCSLSRGIRSVVHQVLLSWCRPPRTSRKWRSKQHRRFGLALLPDMTPDCAMRNSREALGNRFCIGVLSFVCLLMMGMSSCLGDSCRPSPLIC